MHRLTVKYLQRKLPDIPESLDLMSREAGALINYSPASLDSLAVEYQRFLQGRQYPAETLLGASGHLKQ